MINEICHLSLKVEIMVSIRLIAQCKYIKQAIGELFWGFLQFQLPFFRIFYGSWLSLGCCFGVFCSFSYFFSDFFRLLGWIWVLLLDFLQFQLLFPGILQAFRMDLGAVLEILGITAPQDLPAMLSTYGYCTL